MAMNIEAQRNAGVNFKEMKRAAGNMIRGVLRRHPTREIQVGRATARSDRSRFRG
jgi:hypothetical protein